MKTKILSKLMINCNLITTDFTNYYSYILIAIKLLVLLITK